MERGSVDNRFVSLRRFRIDGLEEDSDFRVPDRVVPRGPNDQDADEIMPGSRSIQSLLCAVLGASGSLTDFLELSTGPSIGAA